METLVITGMVEDKRARGRQTVKQKVSHYQRIQGVGGRPPSALLSTKKTTKYSCHSCPKFCKYATADGAWSHSSLAVTAFAAGGRESAMKGEEKEWETGEDKRFMNQL